MCCVCVSLAGLLFEMMMDACSRVVFFFFFEVKRERKFLKNAERDCETLKQM